MALRRKSQNVLLKFCVTVYFNLHFKIKVMHHLKYSPNHVVYSLAMLQSQTDEVKEIITNKIMTKRCDMRDKTCRSHITPNINLSAKTVRELINSKYDRSYLQYDDQWIRTYKITTESSSFSVHTQSVERVVRGFKGFIWSLRQYDVYSKISIIFYLTAQ